MGNKKYTITDSQLELIKKKYEKLMYAVSYRIGGDRVLSSLEDSMQDLYMSAFDACEAYGRKTGLDFDEFFDTVEFDKYIKSTLWNKKNKACFGEANSLICWIDWDVILWSIIVNFDFGIFDVSLGFTSMLIFLCLIIIFNCSVYGLLLKDLPPILITPTFEIIELTLFGLIPNDFL